MNASILIFGDKTQAQKIKLAFVSDLLAKEVPPSLYKTETKGGSI